MHEAHVTCSECVKGGKVHRFQSSAFLQGGKGSTVAMRSLLVENGTKDSRGICFDSDVSDQLHNKLQHRNDPNKYVLTFSNSRYIPKQNGGSKARSSLFFGLHV